VNTFPLAIDPVALQLGPVRLTWYGMILGLGAVLGLLLAIREGKRFHISPDFFMDLLLIGVPMAIIGARTYYVAFEWENYKGGWYETIAVWHGGLAIHGALIGAVLAGIIYTRVKKAPFWRIADICAPSLIAGQMVGRWGNFVNQEAHGGPVPKEFLSDTLHLPDWIVNQMQIGDTYYHPTFLYESVWNLLLLLLLLWLRRRPWLREGELFFSYFALYSAGRFFIEGLRTDSLTFHGPYWLEQLLAGLWSPMKLLFEAGDLAPGGGNVRTAQFISLLLILASLIAMAVRRYGGFARQRYLDPIVIGAVAGAAGGADKPDDGGSGAGGADGSAGGGATGGAGHDGAGAGGADAAKDGPRKERKAEGSKNAMFGWLTNRKRRATDGERDAAGAGAENGAAAGSAAGADDRHMRDSSGASAGRDAAAEHAAAAERDGAGAGDAGHSGGSYTPPRYEPGNPLL